ncbi:alkylglycerol monooxygenase [Trichonephila clavipes]|nr:alkylglycerol monooxygenase [Trichonephila clavipes]
MNITGRNRRYIDKNFGGFLIIWDRIFGTFEAEDLEEKPLYGITTQMKSYNPLVIQTQPFIKLYKRIWEYDNLKDRLSVIFKGPGWSPGKPWTGNIEDIPHPAPDVPKFDPQLPLWCKYYAIVHFFFVVNGYFMLALNMSVLSKATIWTSAAFICYSSISMGFMLDNSKYGPHLEVLRCLIYFLVDRIIISEVRRFGVASVIVMYTNRTLGVLSLAYWISLYLFYNLRRIYKEKNL